VLLLAAIKRGGTQLTQSHRADTGRAAKQGEVGKEKRKKGKKKKAAQARLNPVRIAVWKTGGD